MIKEMKMRLFLFVMVGLFTLQVSRHQSLSQEETPSGAPLKPALLEELTTYPNAYISCKQSCHFQVFMKQEFSVFLFDKDKQFIKSIEGTKNRDIFVASFEDERTQLIIVQSSAGHAYPAFEDVISFKVEEQKAENSEQKKEKIQLYPKDKELVIVTGPVPLIVFDINKENNERKPASMKLYLTCQHWAISVIKKSAGEIRVVSPLETKEFETEGLLPEIVEENTEKESILDVKLKEKTKVVWKNLRIVFYDMDEDRILVPPVVTKKPISRFLIRFVEEQK